jgi:hypothetical protein
MLTLEKIKELKVQAESQLSDIIENLESETQCRFKGIAIHEDATKCGLFRSFHIELNIPNEL